MKKVRKAIIPAAGLGTRFLPATKTVPKEMLPIVDTPIILHVVEEALAAGIEDIIFIQGRGKTAIEDFFDHSFELEKTLEETGKSKYLERVVAIRNRANFISVRQRVALGLGHAVLCGQSIVGDEPFAVLLGDEIMIGKPTVTEQLASVYEQNSGMSTVAIMEVPPEDVCKYGIIDGSPISKEQPTTYKVKSVVEKPEPHQAPSRLALPGRYLFTADLFGLLKDTKPGKNGEIQLTDAMSELAKRGELLATTFVAKRFDAGDKLGFLKANIELGLMHPKLGEPLKKFILTVANRISQEEL